MNGFQGQSVNLTEKDCTALGAKIAITGPTGPTGPNGATGATGPGFTGAPASAAATGTAGKMAYDSGYLYLCVAANTWKRVAVATW